MAKAMSVVSNDAGKEITVSSGDEDLFASGVTGLENVKADDLLIPRLTILQSLSPQLVKSKPTYIPEAANGDFCDAGTNEVFKDSIEILPCYYAKIYLQWGSRQSGKGLIKNHGLDASILQQTTRDEQNRNVMPDGSYVAETATFYVLNMTAGGRRSFIPLSSTQLKHGRRWLTQMTSIKLPRASGGEFTPPMFYQTWVATAVEESNARGSWSGWKFTPGRKILDIDPSKALLHEATDFAKQCRDGLVQGDVASVERDHAALSEEAPF